MAFDECSHTTAISLKSITAGFIEPKEKIFNTYIRVYILNTCASCSEILISLGGKEKWEREGRWTFRIHKLTQLHILNYMPYLCEQTFSNLQSYTLLLIYDMGLPIIKIIS